MMCPQRLKRHVFVVLKRDGGSFCSWPIWPCQSGLAITQLRLVTLGHLPDYSTPIATVGLLIYCCWHSCELRLITKTIKCEMCNFMLQTMYYARCARGCNRSPVASIHQSTLETHMITQSCSSIFLCCRDQFLAKNSVNRDDYLQLQRAENLAAFDLILKNVCKYCGIVTILFFSFWLLCYCQFLTWN